MTTEELVRYSFEALQAWAFEFGLPRQTQQTPIEFARMVGQSFPEISSDALQVARLYSMIAYAGSRSTPDSAEILERLWRAVLVVANDSTNTRPPRRAPRGPSQLLTIRNQKIPNTFKTTTTITTAPTI